MSKTYNMINLAKLHLKLSRDGESIKDDSNEFQNFITEEKNEQTYASILVVGCCTFRWCPLVLTALEYVSVYLAVCVQDYEQFCSRYIIMILA